jgi:Tfp pilus assembly protein FimV
MMNSMFHLVDMPVGVSALIILLSCAVIAGLMRWLVTRSRSKPRRATRPRVKTTATTAATAPVADQPQWPATVQDTTPFDTQILSQFPYVAHERRSMNPLTDAEVYLAFGNDRDAEALLVEAVRTAPMKVGLRIKLAEIYAQRRDSQSFATVAEKLREMVDASGPVWQYICELGFRLDPDHPDYRSAMVATSESTAYLCERFNTGGDGFEDTQVASLPMLYAGEGRWGKDHEVHERMYDEHADRKSPVSTH